jgi:hypothetical protein
MLTVRRSITIQNKKNHDKKLFKKKKKERQFLKDVRAIAAIS